MDKRNGVLGRFSCLYPAIWVPEWESDQYNWHGWVYVSRSYECIRILEVTQWKQCCVIAERCWPL